MAYRRFRRGAANAIPFPGQPVKTTVNSYR